MATMHSWAKLDIGSHQRTRWQRFKIWLFGSPGQVHVSSEIAHGVVSGVVEDHVAVTRAATR